MSGDHNQNQSDSGWRKRQIALNKKAENAHELGLDYEPDKKIMEMAREAGIPVGIIGGGTLKCLEAFTPLPTWSNSMTRDEIISKAKDIGWDAQECNDPNCIAIRAYKSDTNEAMRMGSNGELYTRGADGWMWQVGTVEDVGNAIKAKEQA